MKIFGLRQPVDKGKLVKVLRDHTSYDPATINNLTKNIMSGNLVQLDDDWVLEQDLKDLGVLVK